MRSIAFLRHWLLIFNLLWGIYVTLPWLALVLMATGHERVGRAIYKHLASRERKGKTAATLAQAQCPG